MNHRVLFDRVLVFSILILGVLIGFVANHFWEPDYTDPEVVEVHHTDTLYVGYVDSLSVNGKKWDVERDYGFDRIFPIYHYKIIRVSGLCGADYNSGFYYYGEAEYGFKYIDEDIKHDDKATLNIYQCYDTTYDTTCFQRQDCEAQDEFRGKK